MENIIMNSAEATLIRPCFHWKKLEETLHCMEDHEVYLTPKQREDIDMLKEKAYKAFEKGEYENAQLIAGRVCNIIMEGSPSYEG